MTLTTGVLDPLWLAAGEAYTGLRTALQLTSGLHLAGYGNGETADLRREVLLRVRTLLAEVRDRLDGLPVSSTPYVRELIRCAAALSLVVSRQEAELTQTHDSFETLRMLEETADRLRKCERLDLGVRFFGSGGCADIKHNVSPLDDWT